MKPSFLLCLAFACSLALPAFANSIPFSYSVNDFAVSGRGVSDSFNDGVIGAQWGPFGTVNESSGAATSSNPGVPGFLAPFPLDSDTSGINGSSIAVNGAGNFTAVSTWLADSPDPGTSYSMGLGSQDPTGNTHQIALSVTNTSSDVASVLGSDPGLNVDLIVQMRNTLFAITSWNVTSQAFSASDVSGSVILTLAFSDLLDQVTGSYSLNGGATVYSFDPVPWSFSGGQFALVSSATAIPEPGTAALVALGLSVLGGASRLAGAPAVRSRRWNAPGAGLPRGDPAPSAASAAA